MEMSIMVVKHETGNGVKDEGLMMKDEGSIRRWVPVSVSPRQWRSWGSGGKIYYKAAELVGWVARGLTAGPACHDSAKNRKRPENGRFLTELNTFYEHEW